MLDIQRPVYATLGSIRDIKGSKLIGTKNNYEISRLKVYNIHIYIIGIRINLR